MQCEKIVFASSAAVYGNPDYLPVDTRHQTNPGSPYGLTKLTVENYLNWLMIYMEPSIAFAVQQRVRAAPGCKGEGGVVSISPIC
ncbi:GDP-mannose 4,6-dehydratase [Bacillus licheniformis]|nr:GDP-mannose 4,6-dehydratase [Bacillus licheniformis]